MVDQVTRLNSDSGSFGDGDIATYLGTAQEDPTMEARVAAGVYILTTCYYLLHVTTYYMLLLTTCYLQQAVIHVWVRVVAGVTLVWLCVVAASEPRVAVTRRSGCVGNACLG